MFDIDFSGGSILTIQGRNFTRPGEVPREFGALEQIKKDIEAGGKIKGLHPLDTNAAIAQWTKLLAIYRYELERQAENRSEMAADEDFYDGIQWTEEELAEFGRRGQFPLVFNLIQTSINWILGTQRRAPQDYKILPRRKDGLQAAERKTELMRHVRDENMSNDEFAGAFSDAVKAGLGWMETGQGDGTDGVLVFDRKESWRNIIFDSRHQNYDMSDARFICRTKWMDEDLCMALWPDRKMLISQSRERALTAARFSEYGDDAMDYGEDDVGITSLATSGGAYQRDRIRVIEMWFKKAAVVPVLQGGDFRGELFDDWSQGHWDEIISERATLVMRPREVMHVALMTEAGLLDIRQSPYRHNQFPFTPVWGYRRARDGMPYGAIRNLRGPQQDLNKRASKALHHLSSSRLYVENGSVDDIEETRDEANRPDAVILYKQGRQRPVIEDGQQVAAAHISLMEKDQQMIQLVGGVTDENMGRRTNATSGKAIMAKQDQGSLATSIFFDNSRRSAILHGVKQLINMEQFYTEEDQFRITDSRGNPNYVKINDPQNPASAVHLFKADFIIEEEDWRASSRQAQADQLFDLLSKMAATAPQVVVAILDLAIEASDIPKRDEIVKRIRQTTGQPDPDEDPNNPSPETLERQKQAAAQAAMQERMANAEITEKENRAKKTGAEATALQLGLRGATLEQMQKAISAAIELAGAPAVGAAVDQLMRTAQQDAIAAQAGDEPTTPQAPEMQEGMLPEEQPAMDEAGNPAAPPPQQLPM